MASASVLDHDLLEAYCSVADTRSFSGSARRLGLSQSAVSARIDRLEKKLGRRLLARTTHEVGLTADGEAMLVYAKLVLELAEHAQRHFTSPSIEGSLKFGFSDGLQRAALPIALAQLHAIHPRLQITMRAGRNDDLLRQLDRDELDVVLGYKAAGYGRRDILWSEPLTWFGEESLIADKDLPIPLVVRPEPSAFRGIIVRALAKARRPWVVKFESDDFGTLGAAVSAGLGVTAMFDSLVQTRMPVIQGRELPELGRFELFLTVRESAEQHAKDFAAILRQMLPVILRRGGGEELVGTQPGGG